MISVSRRILVCVVGCILVLAPCADAAKDRAEAPPIQALRALYENNKEFRTTMHKAFANMKDPDDPKTINCGRALTAGVLSPAKR